MCAVTPKMPSYRGSLQEWESYLRELKSESVINQPGVKGAIAEAYGIIKAIKEEQEIQPLAA